MKKIIFVITAISFLFVPLIFAKQEAKISSLKKENVQVQNKRLGGLSPKDALEYMKKTPNIVIVEVNTDYWKLKTGFIGALHIPHDQIANRYNEIPKNVPVILHCGAGVVSVPAYETLCDKRPDIPELSYIAGNPPVSEYNKWYKNTHKE